MRSITKKELIDSDKISNGMSKVYAERSRSEIAKTEEVIRSFGKKPKNMGLFEYTLTALEKIDGALAFRAMNC